MDPFEEFEFKPLSQGLGFQQKKQSKQEKRSEYEFIEDALTSSGDSPLITPTLPRQRPADKTMPSTDTVDEILKTLNDKKKYDFIETASLHQKTATATLTPSVFELSAGLLDAMLIVATFLISMVVMLVVTKVDLFTNLLNPDSQGELYLGTFALMAIITWTYLVAHRIFLGFTPGEWVFDQQIGRGDQIGQAGYSMKVALRSTLVILSGFVFFPILSMLVRRDLLGFITGARLMKKV
jgi:hypothetical protein